MLIFRSTIWLLVFLLPLCALAQKKPLDCDSINKVVVDTLLYKEADGKRLLRGDLKTDLYQITTAMKTTYYVSAPLMQKIKEAVARYKCEGIIIEKVKSNPGKRVVRD